jgi:hypothetical protein
LGFNAKFYRKLIIIASTSVPKPPLPPRKHRSSRSQISTPSSFASFSLLPHKILHFGAQISSPEITQPPPLRRNTAFLKVEVSFVPVYGRVANTPFLFFFFFSPFISVW